MRKCLRKQPHRVLYLAMAAYPLNAKTIVHHMETMYQPGLTALTERQKEKCQDLWFQEYEKLDKLQQEVARNPSRSRWQHPPLMYRPGHQYTNPDHPEYLYRPWLTAREMEYLLQRLEDRMVVLMELLFQ